jgi:hypothetical protein
MRPNRNYTSRGTEPDDDILEELNMKWRAVLSNEGKKYIEPHNTPINVANIRRVRICDNEAEAKAELETM